MPRIQKRAFIATTPSTHTLAAVLGAIVVSKALGVLGHSEFFEPISNLLHRRR
jgi:hypothetical protein